MNIQGSARDWLSSTSPTGILSPLQRLGDLTNSIKAERIREDNARMLQFAPDLKGVTRTTAHLYDETRGLDFCDPDANGESGELKTDALKAKPDPRNANFDPRLWDPNFRPESAQSRPYEPPHDPEDPFAHSFDNTAGDILDGGRHGGSTGTIPPRREVVVRTGGGSAVISSDEQNPNEPRY